jgi:hypothetical protein
MHNIYIICIPEEIFQNSGIHAFSSQKEKKKEILKEMKVEPVE